MTGRKDEGGHEIGVLGLGVMGRNLLLNIASKGFTAAGYNKSCGNLDRLERERGDLPVKCTADLKEFISQLRRPRAIVIMVPAGDAVDSVINGLVPLLDKGDLLIDAGNSHYKDTERREKDLADKGLWFLGVGVSGGEEGARYGPSIMPGGDKAAYERVRPVFEAIAAKAGGEPCAAWLGRGSAGHFVKMVHNGIEYAFMQLLAETYDLMKRGLGMDNDAIRSVFAKWNEEELNSYLLEITVRILAVKDDRTGERLVDRIRDAAGQKGTGMWTSAAAMEYQAPVPTIDAAVTMRDLSARGADRKAAAELFGSPKGRLPGTGEENLERLRGALYASVMMSYAQGLSLLSAASRQRGYELDLGAVAGIWRGGCIIRSAMLEDIRSAHRLNPGLSNLLLDPAVAGKIKDRHGALRAAVSAAALAGLPAPGLMSALGYFDSLRSGRLPASLIQAQRDYFGAHTYERTDTKGIFHTEWGKR